MIFIIRRLKLSFAYEQQDVIVNGVSFEETFFTTYNENPLYIKNFLDQEHTDESHVVSEYKRVVHTIMLYSKFLKFESFMEDPIRKLVAKYMLLEEVIRYNKSYLDVKVQLTDISDRYKTIVDKYEKLKKNTIDFEML